MALGIEERNYNMEQKRQHYSLKSTIEKNREHHLYQQYRQGPSNRQNIVYPDYDFNPPPRLPTPPIRSPPRVRPSQFEQPENSSRDTESIENEVGNPEIPSSTNQSGSKCSGSQRSHAFGSGLQNVFQTTQSSAVQDLPTRETMTMSQSNSQFHDEVLMELCNSKYDHIPRPEKINLIEEILMENETLYMESQLTVPQFVKTLLQRFELAQSKRKKNEYLALKRGLSSRETYSRLIRQKKDSKSNSSLNQ